MYLWPQSAIAIISRAKLLLFCLKCRNEWISSTYPLGSSQFTRAVIQSYDLSFSSFFSGLPGCLVKLGLFSLHPWLIPVDVVLQELLCQLDPLATTDDFICGGGSSLALDRSGLKDGWWGSDLRTGSWIPVWVQSIPTWTFRPFGSPSVQPFLECTSSREWDWLHLFWLVDQGDSCSFLLECSWPLSGWQPLSIFLGIISGCCSHCSSFWGDCLWCPNWSNADVWPVAARLVGGGWVTAALRCWNHSCRAASISLLTGGSWMNFSNTLVAACAMPWVRQLTRSGVDSSLVDGEESFGPLLFRLAECSGCPFPWLYLCPYRCYGVSWKAFQ